MQKMKLLREYRSSLTEGRLFRAGSVIEVEGFNDADRMLRDHIALEAPADAALSEPVYEGPRFPPAPMPVPFAPEPGPPRPERSIFDGAIEQARIIREAGARREALLERIPELIDKLDRLLTLLQANAERNHADEHQS